MRRGEAKVFSMRQVKHSLRVPKAREEVQTQKQPRWYRSIAKSLSKSIYTRSSHTWIEQKDSLVYALVLGLDIKTIQVHHLVPSGNKVLDKLLLSISTAINLRNSPKLSVGSKDEISTSSSPLLGLGLAVGTGPKLTLRILLGPGGTGVEEVDEEVVGQLALLCGEDTSGGAVKVGVEGAEATDEDGHLRGGQGEEGSLVNEELLGTSAGSAVAVVAEAVGKGLEVAESSDISLLLGSVDSTGGEGNLDALETSILSSLLNSSNTTKDNQVSQRNLLGLVCRVELLLDSLQGVQNLLELLGVVAGPAVLRLKGNASTVGTTTLIRVAESRSGVPGGGNELRNIKTLRSKQLSLESGNISIANDLALLLGKRILPTELLLGDLRAVVARDRSEITVEKLEPGAGKGLAELLGVLLPALADFEVLGVVKEGEIASQHGGAAELGLVEGIRVVDCAIEGFPLMGASRALDEGPVVGEETGEEAVAPPGSSQ